MTEIYLKNIFCAGFKRKELFLYKEGFVYIRMGNPVYWLDLCDPAHVTHITQKPAQQ